MFSRAFGLVLAMLLASAGLGCDAQAGSPGLEPPGSTDGRGSPAAGQGAGTGGSGGGDTISGGAGSGAAGNPQLPGGGTGGSGGFGFAGATGGGGGAGGDLDPSDAGADASVDGGDPGSMDAGVGSGDAVDCDPRQITCRRAPPECGEGFVPSVSGTCYGECVPIDRCACSAPAQCPDENQYTCHNFRQRCGPYL